MFRHTGLFIAYEVVDLLFLHLKKAVGLGDILRSTNNATLGMATVVIRIIYYSPQNDLRDMI